MTRYDLLIVGAGIHGIAVAYEAARRGRSFCLVDRQDFGAGASSSSLKILHGGLRYLQSLDIGRSRESVTARRRLMTLVPELVHPLRCRLEIHRRALPYRLLFRVGLLVNDAVTGDRNRGLPRAAHIPRSSFPCWWDAVVLDTERVMLALLGAALEAGAGRSVARNHTELAEITREGDSWHAVLSDTMGHDGDLTIGARVLVRCTGAHRSAGGAGVSMNVMVDPLELTESGDAVALRHPRDGRNVFVVPWRDRTVIGTWDRAYPFDPQGPLRVEPAWIDELLAWLAPVHQELARLSRSHVRLVHAGLLPLEADRGELMGRPALVRGPGALDVVGVKYTTALGVAASAMPHVDALLGAPPRSPAPERALPGYREGLAAFAEGNRRRGEPLLAGHATTRGEVEHAIVHEQARTLGDVMFRRLGLASAGHPGPVLARAVAEEMARHLGWSPARIASEMETFDADWRFAASPDVTRGRGRAAVASPAASTAGAESEDAGRQEREG